jgi:SAM-dependent methyltransferase
MSQGQYFAANELYEAELGRLHLVEKFHDPNTIRYLKNLGVTKGWKCLEVGAGAGSIANWLAAKVGKTGKVVATDIELRFLSKVKLPNLEIRRHNILTDFLESNYYDLVHCRATLSHLVEYEKALNRMADALRPGGWLLIEDFDFGTVLIGDTANPSMALVVEFERTLNDFTLKKGIVDSYFGRRELSMLEKLNFINVDNEGSYCIIRGGGPFAPAAEMTTLAMTKPLVAAGVFTREQVDKFVALLHDPSFYYPRYTLFSAWGQKPLNSIQ